MDTGLEITKILASGAESAAALARSRTMEALVLKRSVYYKYELNHKHLVEFIIPSRVMPGFLGTPAGIKTTSAPDRASLSPEGVGS